MKLPTTELEALMFKRADSAAWELGKEAALYLRATEGEEHTYILKELLRGRRYKLNWLTITQRKWQADTHNPNKAKHHDSIKIREKYVRCYL